MGSCVAGTTLDSQQENLKWTMLKNDLRTQLRDFHSSSLWTGNRP